MRRQFFSWTSGLNRYSKFSASNKPPSWAGLSAKRPGQTNLLKAGWLWTGLILILMLVGSMALLSVFTPGEASPVIQSTPIPVGDGETVIVAPYEPDLGLAADQPWGPLIVDMAVKLALVLGLIVGVIWLLRRYRNRFGKLMGSPNSGASFNVLDRAELGSGHVIYTVDLGRRILVVGATASEVNLLTEVDDPDEMSDIRRRSGVDGGDFDRVFAEAQSTQSESEGAGEVPFRDVSNRLRNLVETGDESPRSFRSTSPTAN